ncbi:ATP-dependent DNA helicase PIF1-like protein [Tanacetum coccineum]|uniref:ATP-dependent DNA helicase PIF1-like protein n=1 Tax=Tanacetum coccineum TaxID=301880 RepID=A0ABQ5H231_9ASTR
MNTSNPNQSTIPFPSRLTDDYCKVVNVLNSATNGIFVDGRRMEDKVKRSTSEDPLPQKEKYPRSFTLPCYINNVCFKKALANLGASVGVMPLTILNNLGLGDLAPTKVTVEMADITIKYPKGVADNVLVGIVVENINIYRDQGIGEVIVGEPFCKAIYVEARRFDGMITIRNGDESVTYQVVGSHLKFKHFTDKRCNNIPSLPKELAE